MSESEDALVHSQTWASQLNISTCLPFENPLRHTFPNSSPISASRIMDWCDVEWLEQCSVWRVWTQKHEKPLWVLTGGLKMCLQLHLRGFQCASTIQAGSECITDLAWNFSSVHWCSSGWANPSHGTDMAHDREKKSPSHSDRQWIQYPAQIIHQLHNGKIRLRDEFAHRRGGWGTRWI